MLASAKQNLEKYAFFGITEHMEESAILFENEVRNEIWETNEATTLLCSLLSSSTTIHMDYRHV